ncbi:MAG: hypothetical protein IT454_21175 [Planctomycetes bacterium]|nr:hypothetical protein [Planctomycetota bacterium]
MNSSVFLRAWSSLALCSLASPALAQGLWTDDFNQPNGPLGAAWSVQNGAFLISNGQAYSTGGDHHWAMHNSANADWRDQRVTLDFLPRIQGPNLFYVGVLLGARPDWLGAFVKVQDNDGDGLYDRVYFWYGVNAGASWGSPGYFDLAQALPAGRMTVYFTGAGDVANLDIDSNFDGATDEHFQLAGVLASPLAPLLSNRVGIASFGSPGIDNFELRDMGQAPAVAYCTSGTTSSGCAPAMSAAGNPSASAASGFTLACANIEGQRSAILSTRCRVRSRSLGRWAARAICASSRPRSARSCSRALAAPVNATERWHWTSSHGWLLIPTRLGRRSRRVRPCGAKCGCAIRPRPRPPISRTACASRCNRSVARGGERNCSERTPSDHWKRGAGNGRRACAGYRAAPSMMALSVALGRSAAAALVGSGR